MPPPTQPGRPTRPLSLGVIFLTLYIDLIGFSIIFPLGPDLLDYYLRLEGHSGLLGWVLRQIDALAGAAGIQNYAPVLFGGVLSSFFSILQFVFAPFWGAVSDRRGRRPVLLVTVTGTAVGYLVWVCSGSFWLFLLSRIVSGGFSGNLSVATAAVADVTSREERSKAMGLVGAAFGLGLVTGPMLGAVTAQWNVLKTFPALAHLGFNPFSGPALVALLLCVANLAWIYRRFHETLPAGTRAESREPRLRNPLRAILGLHDPAIRRANLVSFVYSVAFVAMESALTFLAAQRFGYTAWDNGKLLGFLGLCAIITQGYIVRKLLNVVDEIRILGSGLVFTTVGLLLIGFAPRPWMLYVGLAALALGSGLVNPSTSGLISLYAGREEQGRVLGIFRSLGSLARAVTPMLAGLVFWRFGSTIVFVVSAGLSLAALGLSLRLPKPVK
ncbi:MFS transporter [Opitutus sp. ER46]|uniref:MFS transporter n=1 Tax=Opitutus sp. ER46 TaxID=2161864 RepID=UPI001E47A2C9|nr:MFS transporter [Opitutus sp. ER46]